MVGATHYLWCFSSSCCFLLHIRFTLVTLTCHSAGRAYLYSPYTLLRYPLRYLKHLLESALLPLPGNFSWICHPLVCERSPWLLLHDYWWRPARLCASKTAFRHFWTPVYFPNGHRSSTEIYHSETWTKAAQSCFRLQPGTQSHRSCRHLHRSPPKIHRFSVSVLIWLKADMRADPKRERQKTQQEVKCLAEQTLKLNWEQKHSGVGDWWVSAAVVNEMKNINWKHEEFQSKQ